MKDFRCIENIKKSFRGLGDRRSNKDLILDEVLDLNKPYPMVPLDQKLDLWLKSYSSLTYNWFLGCGSVSKEFLEGKILVIDKMYRNKLNYWVLKPL